MNILIVNRALGTLFGGGESFDYNAARHLMKRGHRVTMITGRPLLGAPRNTVSDVTVVHVPAPFLRRFAYMTEGVNSKLSAAFRHLDKALFERAVWRWYSAQEAGAFDIVQCCSLFSLPRRLLGAARQPVVSWLPGPPSGRVRRLLPGLVADRNFGLFTRGSPEWTLTKMGFERSRDYEIIEPGIDLATIDSTPVEREALRGTLGIAADDLCGVTTARLVPVKNLGLLLEGIAQAKRRGAIWQWLIIGDGPLESRLRQRARALGVLDQTRFLGHRPHAEVYRWLAVADLFALTSSYENFSNAALEAMATRLPVIGTRVGYLQVLISDAQAGRLVSPTDSAELAAALVDFSEARARRRHGEAGRRFVEPLDWPHIAQRLESFHARVIAGRDRCGTSNRQALPD